MRRRNKKGPFSGTAVLIGVVLLLIVICPTKFLLTIAALALITLGIYMFSC